MGNFWQNMNEVFRNWWDDDETSPEIKTKKREFSQTKSSQEAMRISPLEKPSQIAICKPETADEEWLPADYIKTNRPVIVKFEELDDTDREQVRNFMIGVIYALDGTFTKLGDDIYLFAPSEVGLVTKHESSAHNLEQEFFSGELNPEDLLQ